MARRGDEIQMFSVGMADDFNLRRRDIQYMLPSATGTKTSDVGSGTELVTPAKFVGLLMVLLSPLVQIREAMPLVGKAVYAPPLAPKKVTEPPAVNRKPLGIM